MRSRRPILRAASAAALAAIALVACGGGDDETPPVALQQTPATCSALGATTIAAASIGEPTTGAVVTSATYVAATPDTLNAAGTAVIQGLPDYCRVLLDIKPVDATAPDHQEPGEPADHLERQEAPARRRRIQRHARHRPWRAPQRRSRHAAAVGARLPHRGHRQRPPDRDRGRSRRRSRSTPRRSRTSPTRRTRRRMTSPSSSRSRTTARRRRAATTAAGPKAVARE